MRFIFVLALTALITVTVGTFVKEYRHQDRENLVSPLIAGTNTDVQSSSFGSLSPTIYIGWQTFVNNYYGYKIRHPADIVLKNNRNGDITLQKNNVFSISISQKTLSENSTINTAIETDIDAKKIKYQDNFVLTDNVSPIAIGSETAITYSSKENREEYLYFYLPQKQNKYLYIMIAFPNADTADFILAEKIVYSLELSQ